MPRGIASGLSSRSWVSTLALLLALVASIGGTVQGAPGGYLGERPGQGAPVQAEVTVGRHAGALTPKAGGPRLETSVKVMGVTAAAGRPTTFETPAVDEKVARDSE